jgi:predicted TIM-barrel fold metal-dependent hydrolase
MPDSNDLFYDLSTIDYPIIDADAHVNEPPLLWQERVPQKWKARAPKVLNTEKGDVWSFDDGKRLRPLGLTATAGLSYIDFKPFGLTYDTIRQGSFDTKARLRDMDIDGIHTQVIYPSVTLTGASVYAEEPELQRVCVRAYNEWLLEFTEGSDGRLVPLAIVPTTGVKDAVQELEWALDRGHKGAVISSFPNGSLDADPEDEAFWELVEGRDVPVSVHIGSFTRATTGGGGRQIDMQSLAFLGRVGEAKAGGHTLPVVCDLLFAGIWDKHPDLKIVLVESNIGWIPTLLEQTDDMFLRYRFFTKATEQMDQMPSRIFHRQFWATFMIDTVGMDLRHRLNVDHMMWSTDYPHTGCDWPNSRVVIERVLRGVPKDQVKKMLHTNTKLLYGLGD